MAGQWFVRLGQKQHGPFTEDQLRKLLDSQKISHETSVSTDGEYWIKAIDALGGPALPPVRSDSFEDLVDEVLVESHSSDSAVSRRELIDESEMPVGWSTAERVSGRKRRRLAGSPSEFRTYPTLKFYASLMHWLGGFSLILGLISIAGVVVGAVGIGLMGVLAGFVLAFCFFVSEEIVQVFLNVASDIEQQRRATEEMALSLSEGAD